jgi:hypothetical protein
MAEEIITSPEESVSMDAPIVESPVEIQEEVVDVEPTPPVNSDGADNLKKLHKILAADELYSRIVPADFNEFLSNYSDVSKIQKLHKILAADELYGRIMPADINEAADKYGFGGLGKPSAVPSPSVSGGSATKGRGVEQPSMSLPTYLSPEELESGERARAVLPSEQTISVKREDVKQKANMPSAKVIEETTPEMLAEGQQRIIKREAERALFENKAKQGNFLGMLQNSLVEGFTSTVNNTADFTLYLMSLGGIGVSPEYDAASNQEKARIFSETLDDVGIKKTLDKQLRAASTTPEYTQKRTEEGGPIMEGVVGLAGSAFPMLTPQQSGFFINGFVDSKKEIQEAMPDLSPWKQAAYAFTQGAVQVALERAGLSNLAQNKSVTRALSGKVMDAMKTTFGKFTAKEADAYATKVVNAFFAEGETGATQYFVSEGIRQLADALEGDDDKFEFEGGEEFILNIMKSGVSEGVGGVIMKSMAELPKLIKSPTKKKEAAAVNAQTEQLAADIQNPNVSPEAKVAIDKQINDNAEDVAKAYAEDLNKYEALSEESKADLNRINEDIISHEAVLNDPNVSPETKAISEQRIQELEAQGEGILDSAPTPKPTAPVAEAPTEQAPQAEATTEENAGKVRFKTRALSFINEERDRFLYDIEYYKQRIEENKPKTILGKLSDKINKRFRNTGYLEERLAETEAELNELDANPIEYFKRRKENNPDEETKQYFQDKIDYLEQNKITPDDIWEYSNDPIEDIKEQEEDYKRRYNKGDYFYESAIATLDKIKNDPIGLLKERIEFFSELTPDEAWTKEEIDAIINDFNTKIKLLEQEASTGQEAPQAQAAPAQETAIPENLEDTPGYAEAMGIQPPTQTAPLFEAPTIEAPTQEQEAAPQTLPKVENAVADLREQEEAENQETYDKYDEAITPLLEKAKADIEARREEALQQEPVTTDNGYERTFNYGEENEYTIVGKSSQDYYDKINAKYDAELDALNKPTTEAQTPVAEEAKGENKSLTSSEINIKRQQLSDDTFNAKLKIASADDTELAIKEYNNAKKAEADFEAELEKVNIKKRIDRLIDDEKDSYENDSAYEYKELFEKDPRLASLQQNKDMLDYVKSDSYIQDNTKLGVSDVKAKQENSIKSYEKNIADLEADLKENPPKEQAKSEVKAEEKAEEKKADTNAITKDDVKLKRGVDFSMDGVYNVMYGDEVIGRIYYDRSSFNAWVDNDVPPGNKGSYSGYLGTKEEAIQKMVDRYNEKQTTSTKQPTPTTKAEPNIFDDLDATNKRGGIKDKVASNKAFAEKYGEDAAVAKAISTNFEAIADELKAKGIFTKIKC